MLPFQIAVQEACARIGTVTGQGLAAVIRARYGRRVLSVAVILVLIANTINIGADLGAMAAAGELIVPIPAPLMVVGFAVGALLLEVLLSYRAYSRVLRWLSLSLLAYPLTAVIVHQPWATLLRATFVPHVELSSSFLFLVTGVFGTTISPYMFFWETSEEVEDELAEGRLIAGRRPLIGWSDIRRLRIDNIIGMVVSEIVTWSIIVVAATVLHANGVTTIRTAADAAKSLEPLVTGFAHAGYIAKGLFAAGVIGLGLLSVPVLAGSAAYAVAEAFAWPEGLDRRPRQARGFYGVIAAATLVGLAMNFLGIDPVTALTYAAVINGVVAVPLIFLIARIASRDDLLGDYRSGPLSTTLVYGTFVAMGAAAIAMLVTILPV
jgi:Mn2+/Fe2+ NRAMP family transporter